MFNTFLSGDTWQMYIAEQTSRKESGGHFYETKKNQAKGKILSAELFGLKLLAKLIYRALMKFGGIALIHINGTFHCYEMAGYFF